MLQTVLMCFQGAPELHYVEGRWYVYFTAGDSADTNNQFINVLEGPTDIPWGTFTWIGALDGLSSITFYLPV